MGYFDAVLPKREEAPPPRLEVAAPGTATRYAMVALEREAAAMMTAPEGTRNQALNTATFNMGKHVGAGNIDAGTVRNTLAAAARAAGLPQHEIDTVLRDDTTGALSNGMAHPRHPPPREEAPTVTVLGSGNPDVPPTAENPGFQVREKFPLIDWHDLWDNEDEDEEWIIEPLLPARRLVALFSAPKVGKSLLMLEIAAKVAQGVEVLGVTPDRARRVLYVDFENDPRGDVRTRLQAMGVRPDDLENLCYLSYPTLAKLDTWMGAAELMAIVTEYGCELVVIDTISRAVQGEENENDTWLAFYRNTGLALKQAGVACIRLDHTGKDHDKGMRGGSAKYGDVDAVWKLSKLGDEKYQLVCTDHRMKVPEDTLVLHREQAPFLTHRVGAEGRLAAHGAKVDAIVFALNSAGAERSISRDEAGELLRSMGVKARNDVIGEALNQRKMVLP